MMTAWTNDQLDDLGAAGEIEITPRRSDGQLGRPRPSWIVRLADDVDIRSYTGPGGSWFRTASRSALATIHTASAAHDVEVAAAADVDRVAVDAAATTLRLTPEHQEDR